MSAVGDQYPGVAGLAAVDVRADGAGMQVTF